MDSLREIWPHWPTLARIALALVIGLFVGIERERSGKEAGLRTFAFAALLGCVGGLLGPPYGVVSIALLGVLIVLLNLETIRSGEGAEMTTSIALLLVGFAGLLAGRGHQFTPTVLGVVTAGLLAWKQPLSGFSKSLTVSEFRSAVQLAIIAFVVYPALPEGAIDPWGLVDARDAWIAVILIAALGFANYGLLKTYGARGIELTGFLGGLINSTVTVTELARRVHDAPSSFRVHAEKGVALATAAMLLRNALILALLSPTVFRICALPLALAVVGTAMSRLTLRRARGPGADAADQVTSPPPLDALASPFSPLAALKLGGLFLAIEVAGTLAQRYVGAVGLYGVSLIGGVVSSSSAVAAAASIAKASSEIDAAALAALLACATSALVNLPLVARVGRDRKLTRNVALMLGACVLLGFVGAVLQSNLG